MTAKTSRLTIMLLIGAFIAGVYQNCSPGFAPTQDMQFMKASSLGPTPTPAPSSTPAPGATPTATPANGVPAKIVDLNPFKASGNPNLPFNTDFTPYLTSTYLQNLQMSAGYLTNGRVAMDVDEAYPTGIAKPTENLALAATNPKFQQVNAYYHIDRFLVGLKNDQAGPASAPLVHVDAHCKGKASNNAFFDPTEMKICLGSAVVGGTTVWGSNDADASVHEFGHSINHAVSSTDILATTADLGALDEGFADVWAYLNNDNPWIAAWYGKAIFLATKLDTTNFKGLRDLTSVPSYPDFLLGERHDDSVALSSIFYELRQKGIPVSKLRRLVSRVLSDLQAGDDFGAAARYMLQESAGVGIDATLVHSALSARGLYRKDDVSALSLASAGDVLIIDNHFLDTATFRTKTNCNRQLDRGETALVLVNISNSSATALGSVAAKLSLAAATNGVEIPAGGELGSFLRLNASSKYLASLIPLSQNSGIHQINTLFASFVIYAKTAGTYSFNVNLTGFDSQDTTPSTKTINFNLTVGTAANLDSPCPGGGEDAVWP